MSRFAAALIVWLVMFGLYVVAIFTLNAFNIHF